MLDKEGAKKISPPSNGASSNINVFRFRDAYFVQHTLPQIRPAGHASMEPISSDCARRHGPQDARRWFHRLLQHPFKFQVAKSSSSTMTASISECWEGS